MAARQCNVFQPARRRPSPGDFGPARIGEVEPTVWPVSQVATRAVASPSCSRKAHGGLWPNVNVVTARQERSDDLLDYGIIEGSAAVLEGTPAIVADAVSR